MLLSVRCGALAQESLGRKRERSEHVSKIPETKERAPFRTLKSLLPYVRRYKLRIAFALVALVVASLATLVLPLALRRVIDVGFVDGDISLQPRQILRDDKERWRLQACGERGRNRRTSPERSPAPSPLALHSSAG